MLGRMRRSRVMRLFLTLAKMRIRSRFRIARVLPPGVPDALAAVDARSLLSEPSERFQDAEAMRQALEASIRVASHGGGRGCRDAAPGTTRCPETAPLARPCDGGIRLRRPWFRAPSARASASTTRSVMETWATSSSSSSPRACSRMMRSRRGGLPVAARSDCGQCRTHVLVVRCAARRRESRLVTGIAGIGYAWLRAALPDEVPSVLMLEAPWDAPATAAEKMKDTGSITADVEIESLPRGVARLEPGMTFAGHVDTNRIRLVSFLLPPSSP